MNSFLVYIPLSIVSDPFFFKDYDDKFFDVQLNYYDSKVDGGLKKGCIKTSYKNGHKWKGVYENIQCGNIKLEEYKYLMFLDDDVILSSSEIYKFMNICLEMGTEIAQPSVKNNSSYWKFLHNKNKDGIRNVPFCEIMMPCFRNDILKECASFFLESESGWGLDLLWGYKYNNVVVDSVVAEHPGCVTSHLWKLENGLTPYEEKERIIKKYRLPTPKY